MRKILIIIILFAGAGHVFSQDLEVFNRYQDDMLTAPILPEGMSFDEFRILSRNIKLMDMAAGTVFPGYISFKAEEPTAGYIFMGVRILGYAGALYELVKYNNEGFPQVLSNQFDRNFTYVTMGVLISSYLFDWVYGKTQLEKKQEAIRYKYRLKLEHTDE